MAVTLHENISTTRNVLQFNTLMLRNALYHSTKTGNSKSRNNCMCLYRDNNDSLQIGQIQSFFLTAENIPFCLIKNYQLTNSSPISHLRSPRNSTIRQLNVHSLLQRQIIEVHVTTEIVAILVEKLCRKCVLVEIKNLKKYCIPLPNTFEVH